MGKAFIISVLICSVLHAQAYAQGVPQKNRRYRQARMLHRKFMNVTAAMPFAGRTPIRNSIRNLQQSRGTPQRWRAVTSFGATMSLYIGMHGYQALMGMSEATYRMDQLMRHPSPTSAMAFGIAGLYSAANIAVTYTQVGITHKVFHNLSKHRGKTARPIGIGPANLKQMMMDAAFTVAAQAAFLAVYLPHEIERWTPR